MSAALFVSIIGLLLLVARLWPLAVNQRKASGEVGDEVGPRVSLIVPARNEEANLPRLLDSLSKIRYTPLEVVFVNDQSSDATGEILSRFQADHSNLNVIIVDGVPRPANWTGKNWACHQGVKAASGQYLAFTDADTWHEPSGIATAVERMKAEQLDLISALPYHLSETLWERLIGPFHIFLLVTTGAFLKPQPDRVFAIGQFLMFRSDWYRQQGGHAAVHSRLCEDLELAAICLRSGGRYQVEYESAIFRVRMYERFNDFVNGWRRIFRLGIKHARWWAPLELYAIIGLLTGGAKLFAAAPVVVLLMVVGLFVVAFAQRRLGEFSVLGVILIPFSVILFLGISILAAYDLLLQKEYSWRGRNYKVTAD